MKYSAAIASFTLLLLGYFHPITALTQDLGRHLLTGNLILQTGSIPSTNLFSYTYPDFSYINTHWLSQVLFAITHRLFGFPGLFVLMLLLVSIALGLQLWYMVKHMSAVVFSLVSLLYLGVLFERTDLRPELFSFLLLSIFVTLLYRYRETATRWIYLLIPLQLLWVNLHIYFAIGLVVIGLFLLDAVIVNRRKLMVPVVKQLMIVFLLSCVASLLNPHGMTGLLYPLHVFQNYGYTIEENQSVFFLERLGFTKPSFPYLLFAVLLLFTSLSVSYKKTRPVDWLLSVVFTYLAFSAVRNMPLFVFATFIPATHFSTIILSRFAKMLPSQRFISQTLWLGILLLFLWQGMIVIQRAPLGYGVEPGASQAVDFLLKEKLPGPLFNNFDIGGYLIYRLYPQERIFVDGRPEAYPAAFFSDVYKPMQENPAVFKEMTKRYGFQTIFFSHTDQTPWANTFLAQIVTDNEWKIVYLDDYAIILVKNTPENASLLSRLGMSQEKVKVTSARKNFDANLRLAAFFSKVGWNEQGMPYYLALLEEKPDFCPALGVLTQLYQAQGNPAAAIYMQRYNQACL